MKSAIMNLGRFPPAASGDFHEIPNFSLQVIFFVSEANSVSPQYELLRSIWTLSSYPYIVIKGKL